MVCIDFENDKNYGPFGLISRREYRALDEKGRKEIRDLGYWIRRQLARIELVNLREFEEKSETVRIEVKDLARYASCAD